MSTCFRRASFFLAIIYIQRSILACPTGYSQQGTLCLKAMPSPDVEQCSAKQTCFNEGGRLPILHSSTESSDFDTFCTTQSVSKAWLGLTSSNYNTHPAFWTYPDGSKWVAWAPAQPGESGLQPTVYQQIGSGAYDTATELAAPVCEADPTVSDTCDIAAVCSGLGGIKSSYLGSCYTFESTARSWDAAMDYCNNNAPSGTVGHLAWFYGACGYETIRNDLRSQGATTGSGQDIWVGMKEKDLNSTRGNLWWHSDTATAALPVGWGPDKMGGILEPDDSGQDCMRIWYWDDNNFQDSDCGNANKFLCEFKCPENVISTYEIADTWNLNCANMGGVSHDERCYLLDTNGDPANVKRTFDEGQAICSTFASHGPNGTIGRLGQIRDNLAWETVNKMMDGTTGVFIGLIDKVGDDAVANHVWSSKQSPASDDAALAFTSKMAVNSTTDRCVKIVNDGAGDLHWTDASCDENNYILCELYCNIVTPVSTAQPTATTTEQATTTAEQATTTTTEQSTTTPEQATTTNEQSTTTTTEQTSMTTERATTATEQAATTTTEPASTTTEQATTITEQVTSTMDEQATTTTEQASITTEQATTTIDQASTTTEQATTTTEQAATSTTTPTEQATTTTEQATTLPDQAMTTEQATTTTTTITEQTSTTEEARTLPDQATTTEQNTTTTTTTEQPTTTEQATTPPEQATTTNKQETTTTEQATTTSEQAAVTTDQAVRASGQATTAEQPTDSVRTAKPANQIYHVKQDSKYDQVSPTSPLMQFNTKGLLACSVHCAYQAECRYAQFEDSTGVCYLIGGINDQSPKLAVHSGYRVGLYKPPE